MDHHHEGSVGQLMLKEISEVFHQKIDLVDMNHLDGQLINK
jgi:hypothetical protein